MPISQINNDPMAELLSAHFPRRTEAAFAWGNTISAYMMIPLLRAFWPTSSVVQGGALNDISGNGQVLTDTANPDYNLYSLAPYCTLDGSTQFFTRADEANLRISGAEAPTAAAIQGMTIGCWIRPGANVAANRGIMTKYVATGNQRNYILYQNSSYQPAFQVSSDGTAATDSPSSVAFTEGIWQFVVGKYVPSTSLDVFLNLTKTSNVTSIPASIFSTSTAAFEIGTYNAGAVTPLLADFSMGFLCAAALPDYLINALYHWTRPLFGV